MFLVLGLASRGSVRGYGLKISLCLFFSLGFGLEPCVLDSTSVKRVANIFCLLEQENEAKELY